MIGKPYIKDILSCGGHSRGSKVLITTCDNDVGVYANVNRVPHKLRFLTEYESWELLQFEVSRSFGACPRELGKLVKVIAAKSDGLPLQIVAVAGILVAKLFKSPALRIEKEWLEVSRNVNLFLHNESSIISDVVELTYSILPGDLKDCFLYMGVFPEDYEISVWTLTSLWIAEGFVKPNYGQSLEDKAVQNLDDLITKNLVMVEKINPIGEVKTCRLHNMIRGFCVYKAREQNLFQEIKRSEEGVLEPPLSQLQYSRRLCLQSNDNTLLSQLPYTPRVRSFLSFNESSSNGLDRSSISTVLDAFKFLKVLAIKLDHQQPRRLTKLFHLTFITLSVEDLSVLPESLSKLWNLQTLVVDTKSRLITIEANIWKMIWLRHLKTNATIVLSRKGGEGKGGENLQTLSRLSPECTPTVCERARNLKTLGIRGNLDNLFKYSLEKMHRLQKLKLVNESLQELHQFEKLKLRNESLLHELSHYFPPNITRLTLSKTLLKWKQMSTLACIKTLEVLKLKDNAFTGIYWSAVEDNFSALRFLLISDTDLVHWEASPSSFPNHRFLVLKKCENLNEIPWEVAKNHLEKLDIEYVGESAVQSAKTIVELKKHAEENDKAEKAKWKQAEEDDKAEISKWKLDEEDEKTKISNWKHEKVEKGNWRSPFKLTIGPGCY